MVEKATLSQEDKKKINELLNQENALEFMPSEESEEEDVRTQELVPQKGTQSRYNGRDQSLGPLRPFWMPHIRHAWAAGKKGQLPKF